MRATVPERPDAAQELLAARACYGKTLPMHVCGRLRMAACGTTLGWLAASDHVCDGSQLRACMQAGANGYGRRIADDKVAAMKNWVFLAVAICAEVTATSALKSSEGFTRLWPSLLTVLGYGISFYFLGLTLRVIPVGIAYALWSGAGIVLISLVAWALHGQRLDAPAMLGMGLIAAGAVVINVFSKVAPH